MPRDASHHVGMLGLDVHLEQGETIRTEICRKFTREDYGRHMERFGLRVRHWHSDTRGYFSLVDLVRT